MSGRAGSLLPTLFAAVRRSVTVPLVIVVEVLLLLGSPVLVALASVASVATRSTRPLRSALLVLAYVVIELSVLPRLIRADADDWDELLREVLGRGNRAMERILDVRLAVEEGSATAEQIRDSPGLVVLARHCGPGDSLFIAWLLAVRYRLRLHVVLTTLMRLEPTVDLAADHLPLCFVGHGPRSARARIEDLAASMSPGDALLLFPEGGNFSWPRWHRAMSLLAAAGAVVRERRARRLTHTLPPHLGGALAALTGAPDADVLLLEHTGFADDGRARPWWRLPVHRVVVVRTVLVPAASVPREHDALSAWLDTAWSQVDAWVAAHAVARGLTPGATAPAPPAA